MKIYCITHKPLSTIQSLDLTPFGVGTSNFPNYFVVETKGENIANKNINYSETSFHYWYWKNALNNKPKDEWFGMCQYRRYFVKHEYKDQIDNLNNQGSYSGINNLEDLKKMLQLEPAKEWNNYDVILCEPWSVKIKSKTKLLKKGLRSLINDPTIFFDEKKQNIKLHFEMFHGFKNLQKAIEVLPEKDKDDFINYITSNNMLPGHCIFFAKNNDLINTFYSNLFYWLSECEKVFGFNLKGYGNQRIYSFLTERYMPFWFNKYAKVKYWPWVYCDITKF
tara:strand:+ start:149 stop:985 length:837 start_codon:yes stop_codon:yes gene_type:complete